MPFALMALGYLSGSIPFGVLATRLFAGKDVREGGSGNIGATNVARVAGKKVGALVLLLDALKGALPVWLAMSLLPQALNLHATVALLAFCGHVFPVWLRFKGGKGVATALGVLAVLLPESAALGFVLWAVIVAVFRVSSIGSLVGGVAAVTAGFFFGRPWPYAVLGAAIFLGMLLTHRDNIRRILARTENTV